MAKIAIAGFVHETNTFSPLPTTYEDFASNHGSRSGIKYQPDFEKLLQANANVPMVGFAHKAIQYGHDITFTLWATTPPSGTVQQAAFDRITAAIQSELTRLGPFDAVYLDLHGAMVSEAYDDAETEVLKRIQQVVGQHIPIVAALDLHGNIPATSVEAFSVLNAYRSYPHIDMYETGARCADLMEHLLSGKPLFKAYRQLPFLIPLSTASSMTEPCRSIYADLPKIETQPGVVSVSFMHGFVPADLSFTGPSVFAYGLNQQAADNACEQLADLILRHEEGFKLDVHTAEEGVRLAMVKAKNASKPVILADVQDNPGGGGTSDTVWVLSELVSQGAECAAVGLIYDPEAAALAHQAGEGAVISIGLGGKLMPGHTPFTSDFVVEKLSEGEFAMTGPMGRGLRSNLGKMAQLRIGGVRIVVCSSRAQANDQAYFRQVGIEPTEMKILVLKSTNHYRADFQPIASEIMVVTAPGAIMENLPEIPYTKLREGVRLGGKGPAYTKRV